MPEGRRQISEERKAIFYIGSALMGIGLLLFFSTFLSFACHFGEFKPGENFGKSLALRGFGGMFLLIIGSMIRGVGAAGVAGSGLKLDPQQARTDLEPWSRMAGGMVNDTLSEIEPVQKMVDKLAGVGSATQEVVKVRCRSCQALNDETAKFCNQCGGQI